MTPAELRRVATELLNDCDCGQNGWIIAQHVLDTVREDDGEALTKEWLVKKFGRVSLVCGWIVDEKLSIWNSSKGFSLYTRDVPENCDGQDAIRVCTIKTRGQLRRLLEGLGVDCAK